MRRVQIRFAKEADAKGILEAQYSAVHDTAAKDYPAEVISQWTPAVTRERIETYLTQSFPEETTVVAEIDGEIAGFGSIVERANELRAVYVSARFGRLGVGTALLAELEKVARAKGCKALQMASSLTAEPFYRRHGYQEIGRGFHTLRSGRKMACVRMSKPLG